MQDAPSFSSDDTIFSSKLSADQDHDMHLAVSAASSRATSPSPVAALLHPCPMLPSQSYGAIAKVGLLPCCCSVCACVHGMPFYVGAL